jgi:26S proteasome regulatory subunit N5
MFIEEKAARQASDHNKLAEICTRIVQMSFDNNELQKMREFFL